MAASQPLTIAIIGAGLGGLAAALSLSLNGHSVHVYEVNPALSELGAGIQIPPNAARILYRWGLGEILERQATVQPEESLRRFSTGDVVGHQRKNTKDAFGFVSSVIHRADFQRMLFERAEEKGVRFTFARKVGWEDVQGSDGGDQVLAAAKIIVAADGISSTIRAGLNGHDDSLKPTLTGDTASRVILPRELFESDPQLRHLVEKPTNNVWMGPKRHVVAYTIRSTELYNVVLCGPGEAPVGTYNQPYDPNTLASEYSDFEPTVRGILSKATQAHRWTISEIPSLPRWTDGRVVLLGDAAHAMMPYAAQGAAQCIEDAAVLAACLRKVRSGGKVEPLLRQYELLRRPRVERVQEVARGNRFLYGLEDGEEQRERDKRLSQSLKPAPASSEQKTPANSAGRPAPDSQAKYGSPEFSEWLYGLDVEQEALEQLKTNID